MSESILTYRITKRFSTKRDAVTAGLILTGWTGQEAMAFRYARTGPREWTLQLFLRDVDLQGRMASDIQHVLQYGKTSYGSETFTS